MCSMGTKHQELDTCVGVTGLLSATCGDVAGITGMWWDAMQRYICSFRSNLPHRCTHPDDLQAPQSLQLLGPPWPVVLHLWLVLAQAHSQAEPLQPGNTQTVQSCMLDGSIFLHAYIYLYIYNTHPQPLPMYRHTYMHSKKDRTCLRKQGHAEQYRAWPHKHTAQPLFTHLQTLSFPWSLFSYVFSSQIYLHHSIFTPLLLYFHMS